MELCQASRIGLTGVVPPSLRAAVGFLAMYGIQGSSFSGAWLKGAQERSGVGAQELAVPGAPE